MSIKRTAAMAKPSLSINPRQSSIRAVRYVGWISESAMTCRDTHRRGGGNLDKLYQSLHQAIVTVTVEPPMQALKEGIVAGVYPGKFPRRAIKTDGSHYIGLHGDA